MTRVDRHTNDPSQAAAFERIHGEEHEFAQPPWNNPPTDPRPLADGKAGQVVTCGEHDLTGTHGEKARDPVPDLIIAVHGVPAPQGSKRHVGHGVMVESSAKVKPWRESVKWAVLMTPSCTLESVGAPLTGPVDIAVTFYLPRPKGHYRTGRNAHLLRDAAPKFPAGKPDLDKLLRSTLDALGEAAVFRDDAQVVAVGAGKVYADQHPVGADITVWAI